MNNVRLYQILTSNCSWKLNCLLYSEIQKMWKMRTFCWWFRAFFPLVAVCFCCCVIWKWMKQKLWFIFLFLTGFGNWNRINGNSRKCFDGGEKKWHNKRMLKHILKVQMKIGNRERMKQKGFQRKIINQSYIQKQISNKILCEPFLYFFWFFIIRVMLCFVCIS